MEVKTVGQLRKFLEKYPDDTELVGYNDQDYEIPPPIAVVQSDKKDAATFSYEAKYGDGKKITGSMAAESKYDLEEKLEAQHLKLISSEMETDFEPVKRDKPAILVMVCH